MLPLLLELVSCSNDVESSDFAVVLRQHHVVLSFYVSCDFIEWNDHALRQKLQGRLKCKVVYFAVHNNLTRLYWSCGYKTTLLTDILANSESDFFPTYLGDIFRGICVYVVDKNSLGKVSEFVHFCCRNTALQLGQVRLSYVLCQTIRSYVCGARVLGQLW